MAAQSGGATVERRGNNDAFRPGGETREHGDVDYSYCNAINKE